MKDTKRVLAVARCVISTYLLILSLWARGVTQMCQDYRDSGYWAILQTPKHIINGIVIHLVARALRWHINRMLGGSFVVTDEVRPWPKVVDAEMLRC